MIVKDEQQLRQKCEPVSSPEEAKGIIAKLEKELAYNSGVGLSAPQIGIQKQVAIVRFNKIVDGKYKKIDVDIINPKDVQHMDGEFLYKDEGCLSFPGVRKTTIRSRSFQFTSNENECHYYSINEGPGAEYLDQMFVIACQHEVDHLEGKLFLDHQAKPELTENKVGRNESCPCGSGKKFKKCCLKKYAV